MKPGRGSLPSRLLRRTSALCVRPALNALPANRLGATMVRAAFAASMPLLAPALEGTVIESIRYRGVHGEWVRGPGTQCNEAVVLYLHGGGFVSCSPRTHRGLTSRLSTATGLPVFTLAYRRAPEHRFPAAHHDVLRAYHWLIGEGYAPDRIVLAADSAGGRLAIDLLIANAATRVAQPGAVVLFSPLVDTELQLAESCPEAHEDPMFALPKARRITELYTDGSPWATALPRLEVGTSLPPFMIHAAEREFLVGDAHYLADRLRAAGTTCDLTLWPDQVHAFPTLTRVIPEAREVCTAAASFISTALGGEADRLVG